MMNWTEQVTSPGSRDSRVIEDWPLRAFVVSNLNLITASPASPAIKYCSQWRVRIAMKSPYLESLISQFHEGIILTDRVTNELLIESRNVLESGFPNRSGSSCCWMFWFMCFSCNPKLKTGMPCYHVTMSYHFTFSPWYLGIRSDISTMDLDNVLRISEISQPVVKVMGALLAGGTGPWVDREHSVRHLYSIVYFTQCALCNHEKVS